MIPVQPYILTQGYKVLKVNDPYPAWLDENGQSHTTHFGFDLGIPTGKDCRNAYPGIVRESDGSAGFGEHVVVEHLDGTLGRYAHLSEVIAKPGDFVGFGALLGKTGNTGISSGPHLHFDVYRKRDGKRYFTNPQKYIDMKQEMAQNVSQNKGEFYFWPGGDGEAFRVSPQRAAEFALTILQRLGLGKSVDNKWVEDNYRGKNF